MSSRKVISRQLFPSYSDDRTTPTIHIEEFLPEPTPPTGSHTDYSDIPLPERDGNDISLNILLRKSAFEHADKELFWSEQRLKEILGREQITSRLADCGTDERNLTGMVHKILSGYLKVFAVLVLIEEEKQIWNLAEQGLDNNSLPLIRMDPIYGFIARASSPAEALPCFKTWKTCERDRFIQWQYRVDPAYLDLESDRRTIQHRIFGPSHVLPFLQDEYTQTGGYGAIYKVKIEAQCHGFRDILKSVITDDVFALKRIQQSTNESSREEREFLREVEALKRYSGFVHDHLVTLLMTWTMKNNYCLLFPWAGLDLDEYWSKTSPPIIDGVNPDIPTVRWLAKQIVGMAGALNTIHNPRYDGQHLVPKKKYGRHGDIKPENILWYQSPTDEKGILVIADLGLTTFNTTNSRSNVPGQGIPVSPGYRPPECDLKGGVVSRAFDIWTFGCVLLELCCWSLGGQDNRNKFSAYRTTSYITGLESDIFFDVGTRTDGPGHICGVKKQVHEWIAGLHGRPTCTQFFHELLDLIEGEMIVTMSANKERIRSDALLTKLGIMYQRVSNPTDTYCQYSLPQRREPRYCQPVEAVLNDNALGLIKALKPHLKAYSGTAQMSKTPEELSAVSKEEETGFL